MLISTHPPLITNQLLLALPRADIQRLQDKLELLTLSFGEVLYESGG